MKVVVLGASWLRTLAFRASGSTGFHGIEVLGHRSSRTCTKAADTKRTKNLAGSGVRVETLSYPSSVIGSENSDSRSRGTRSSYSVVGEYLGVARFTVVVEVVLVVSTRSSGFTASENLAHPRRSGRRLHDGIGNGDRETWEPASRHRNGNGKRRGTGSGNERSRAAATRHGGKRETPGNGGTRARTASTTTTTVCTRTGTRQGRP